MKTGECKFGERCRFHHPFDRTASTPLTVQAQQQSVKLSLAGLPRREVCCCLCIFFQVWLLECLYFQQKKYMISLLENFKDRQLLLMFWAINITSFWPFLGTLRDQTYKDWRQPSIPSSWSVVSKLNQILPQGIKACSKFIHP